MIFFSWTQLQLSHNARKRTFRHVRPAKIQIRLRIGAVWSDTSVGANFHADKGDSAQTESPLCAYVRRIVLPTWGSFNDTHI